ncbi:hypothetical protein CSUI_005301, partial [Cystoisospora suis]
TQCERPKPLLSPQNKSVHKKGSPMAFPVLRRVSHSHSIPPK